MFRSSAMSHLTLFEPAQSMAALPTTASNLEYINEALAAPDDAEQVHGEISARTKSLISFQTHKKLPKLSSHARMSL